MSLEQTALQKTAPQCCVCLRYFLSKQTNNLRADIIRCQICNRVAHKYCYDPSATQKEIVCDGCQKNKHGARLCCICHKGDGLLKLVDTNKYGHVICLLFSPSHLVKSYCNLQFVQIKCSPTISQTSCHICGTKGNRADLSQCSFRDCNKRCHRRCLLKQSIGEGQGWVHSLWSIDTQYKIEMAKYFSLFEVYIKQCFINIFPQKPTIITEHDSIISLNCQIYCKEHRYLYNEECLCRKQKQQKMIFCDFCHSWNHLKCQKVRRYLPEKYKCLQCRDWEGCVKKKKKSLLQNYPKLGLYDLIYIHQYFEKNKYRLAEKQFDFLKKIPIGPSLHFYSRFAQLHFYQKISGQINTFILQQAEPSKQSAKSNRLQKIKTLKLIKILLASYDNLACLKEELMDKKIDPKKLKVENITALLKQFNQFRNKCLKMKSFIIDIRMVQMPNPENSNFKDVKIQDIHEQYQTQQDSSKEQSQETASIQSNEQNNQMRTQVQNSINYPRKTSKDGENDNYRKQHSRINVNTLLKRAQIQNESNLNFMDCSFMEAKMFKHIRKLRKKGRKQLLQLQRDLELAAWDQQKKRAKPFHINSEQISQRLALRSLELDLMDQVFRLNLTTRENILLELKKSKIELSPREKDLIILQTELLQLMCSLKQTQNIDIQAEMHIKDISECKLSYANIKYFFKFFSKCRHIQLIKYRLLCDALRQVAQKMINCNTKHTIKSEQQIDAYETILNNLGLQSTWIEEQLRRKNEVQTGMSKLGIQSERFNTTLSIQVVNQAMWYCEEHKMSYLLPKLQRLLRWYQIYETCSKKIPSIYTCPHQLVRNEKSIPRIDGLIFQEIWLQMKAHQFPDNRLKQTIRYYCQKYQQQTRSAGLFLTIFDTNIKGDKCEGNAKYCGSEIATWISKMRHSTLDHSGLINQVGEIVYVFEHLQEEVMKHEHFTADTQEILKKIRIIPILFPFEQQVVSKPRPVWSIDTQTSAISIDSSKNNANQQSQV